MFKLIYETFDMANRIFQFKIQMKEIFPVIWRRILVPEKYNFWDLHVAIQDSMGWSDSHLHVFRIKKKHAHSYTEIGIPDEGEFVGESEILAGWEIPISQYFSDVGDKAEYEYDFGDCWQHELLLEGIFLREKGTKYPKCIIGKRACPPEDCGGVPGYYNLLEIISNKDHKEYENMVMWLGKKYDPDHFIPDEVKFDNPKKRFKRTFSSGL